MQNSHEMVCVQCGGKEIGQGKQSGYATVSPYKKMGFGSHLICTDCGWVVGSYVEDPSAFKKTIKRKK
ncbi:transcription initiation factor TFIIIB [Lysinibacillus sp. NPDC096418]|uniref:transcription initiation factor TFIIIB n=1 Tax=Lysinibacillus sp. NPDC096418 TaxID=3364138 RepID=UPI0037F6E9E7